MKTEARPALQARLNHVRDQLKQRQKTLAELRATIPRLEASRERSTLKTREARENAFRILRKLAPGIRRKTANDIFIHLSKAAETQPDLPAFWTRLDASTAQQVALVCDVLDRHGKIKEWAPGEARLRGQFKPEQEDILNEALRIARQRKNRTEAAREQLQELKGNFLPPEGDQLPKELEVFFEGLALIASGKEIPANQTEDFKYARECLTPFFGPTLTILCTPPAAANPDYAAQIRESLFVEAVHNAAFPLQSSPPKAFVEKGKDKDKPKLNKDGEDFLALLNQVIRNGSLPDRAAEDRFTTLKGKIPPNQQSDIEKAMKNAGVIREADETQICTLRTQGLKTALFFLLNNEPPGDIFENIASYLLRCPVEVRTFLQETIKQADADEAALQAKLAPIKGGDVKATRSLVEMTKSVVEREHGVPECLQTVSAEKRGRLVELAHLQLANEAAAQALEQQMGDTTAAVRQALVGVGQATDQQVAQDREKALGIWHGVTLPAMWSILLEDPAAWKYRLAHERETREANQGFVPDWKTNTARDGTSIHTLSEIERQNWAKLLGNAPAKFTSYPPVQLSIVPQMLDAAHWNTAGRNLANTEGNAKIHYEHLTRAMIKTLHDNALASGGNFLAEDQYHLLAARANLGGKYQLESKMVTYDTADGRTVTERRWILPPVFYLGCEIPHPDWDDLFLGDNLIITAPIRQEGSPFPMRPKGRGYPSRIGTSPFSTRGADFFQYFYMAQEVLAYLSILGIDYAGLSPTSYWAKAQMNLPVLLTDTYLCLDGLSDLERRELMVEVNLGAAANNLRLLGQVVLREKDKGGTNVGKYFLDTTALDTAFPSPP